MQSKIFTMGSFFAGVCVLDEVYSWYKFEKIKLQTLCQECVLMKVINYLLYLCVWINMYIYSAVVYSLCLFIFNFSLKVWSG